MKCLWHGDMDPEILQSQSVSRAFGSGLWHLARKNWTGTEFQLFELWRGVNCFIPALCTGSGLSPGWSTGWLIVFINDEAGVSRGVRLLPKMKELFPFLQMSFQCCLPTWHKPSLVAPKVMDSSPKSWGTNFVLFIFNTRRYFLPPKYLGPQYFVQNKTPQALVKLSRVKTDFKKALAIFDEHHFQIYHYFWSRLSFGELLPDQRYNDQYNLPGIMFGLTYYDSIYSYVFGHQGQFKIMKVIWRIMQQSWADCQKIQRFARIKNRKGSGFASPSTLTMPVISWPDTEQSFAEQFHNSQVWHIWTLWSLLVTQRPGCDWLNVKKRNSWKRIFHPPRVKLWQLRIH